MNKTLLAAAGLLGAYLLYKKTVVPKVMSGADFGADPRPVNKKCPEGWRYKVDAAGEYCEEIPEVVIYESYGYPYGYPGWVPGGGRGGHRHGHPGGGGHHWGGGGHPGGGHPGGGGHRGGGGGGRGGGGGGGGGGGHH